MMQCRSVCVAVLAHLLVACGEGTKDGTADADGDVVEESEASVPPEAPAVDDPAYSVALESSWLMVGDGLTPPDDSLGASVTAPVGVEEIEVWVEGDGPHAFSPVAGVFDVAVDVSDLPPGAYTAVFALPGEAVGFASRVFNRSHALYVIMATDWDDPDNATFFLDTMDQLRARHPELRYTHYFGPYTLTDPSVSPARRAWLVDWIVERRDASGDEIGVHLHPYCSFVDTTAVTCRTEPSDVYDGGDATGYTVIVASYTVEEMTALLAAAADLFESSGLGRPVSYRSGGWTADEGTLAAIEAAGYAVDADAIVAERIEEWEGMGNGVFYEWLMEHWGDITITSQPYRPSRLDASVPGSGPEDTVDVLEIPANAVIVDYVTAVELSEIFEANWPARAPLDRPTLWHTGLHPPNFGLAYMGVLDEALTTADLYLHSAGAGPVVYATAGEMPVAFPPG